jgi:hypothetical protein
MQVTALFVNIAQRASLKITGAAAAPSRPGFPSGALP